MSNKKETSTITIEEIGSIVNDISSTADEGGLFVTYILSLSNLIRYSELDTDTLDAIVSSISNFCEKLETALDDIFHMCYEITFYNVSETAENIA